MIAAEDRVQYCPDRYSIRQVTNTPNGPVVGKLAFPVEHAWRQMLGPRYETSEAHVCTRCLALVEVTDEGLRLTRYMASPDDEEKKPDISIVRIGPGT